MLDVQQGVGVAKAIAAGQAGDQIDHHVAARGGGVVNLVLAAAPVDGVVAGTAIKGLERGDVAAGEGVGK